MRVASRRVVLVGAAAGVVAVIAVLALGSVLLPGFVRRAAVERLQAMVTAPVRIEAVRLNLFTGRARVVDVVIGGADGSPPVLRLPSLDLQVSYRALLRGRIRVNYLAFRDPRLFVERTGPESVNVVQVLKPREGGEPSRVTVEEVRIDGGAVTFVDRTQSPAFERTFTSLQLVTGRLSTLPELRLTPTSFELRVAIGQGALVVAGAAAPFGHPGGVELTARMERLDPGMFRGYVPLRARVDLRGGWVSGEVRYVLAYRGRETTTNALTAHVETGPIRFLAPEGDAPLLEVDGLAGRDIAMDFLGNRMRLGDVVVRTPRVALERAPDGTFNLARLLELADGPAAAPPPAAADAPTETRQSTPPAEPRPAFSLVLGQLRIEQGALAFTDRTLTPAAATALGDIRLALRDVGVGPGARPGRVEGDARIGRGRVRLTGLVDAQTGAGRGRLVARGVPLGSVRGYLDAALPRARVRAGTADAQLDLTLTRRQEGVLALELAGAADGRDLAIALPDAARPVVQARRLGIRLVRLALSPAFSADVDLVRLTGGTLDVVRARDGSLNLARLWGAAAGEEAVEATVPAAGSPPPPAVTFRRVELADTRVRFADTSVSPTFETALTGLAVELARTPGDPRRMAVRARGALAPSASVELTGWVTPLTTPLRAGVDLAVRDYELSALSPYAVRYASHRITRGRVTARTAVEYENGGFTADNRITIQHLQVGEEVDPELREGLGIPLKLAAALLEDSAGEIRLDVPVTGGPDGLRYQLGSVIRTAIRNAVVKTVAAPFRGFGSLLTFGGKIARFQVDPVEFRGGSLEPNDEASERLARVIEFLKSHPKIELQLRGIAVTTEVEPFKRERLRARLFEPAIDADTPLQAAYHEAGGPFTRDPPPAEDMRAFILDRMEITDRDLAELAQDRARTIEDTLVRRGVARERLFVVSGGPEAVADGGIGRVEFQLLY